MCWKCTKVIEIMIKDAVNTNRDWSGGCGGGSPDMALSYSTLHTPHSTLHTPHSTLTLTLNTLIFSVHTHFLVYTSIFPFTLSAPLSSGLTKLPTLKSIKLNFKNLLRNYFEGNFRYWACIWPFCSSYDTEVSWLSLSLCSGSGFY